jgi:hypothetical protein
MTGRGDRPRHRAEAMLRGHAIDRCPPWGLPRWRGGARSRPTSMRVTSTTQRVFWADATVRGRRHRPDPRSDPDHHPDLVPPKQPARFAERIACGEGHCLARRRGVEDTETRFGPLGGSARAAAFRSRDRGDDPGPRRAPKPARGRFPDGRNAGAAEEPRRDSERLGRMLADDHVRRCDAEAGHPGTAGWRGEEIAQSIRAHPQFGKTMFLDTAASDDALAAAFADGRYAALSHRSPKASACRPRGAGPRIASDLLGSAVLRAGLGAMPFTLTRGRLFLGGNDKKTNFGQRWTDRLNGPGRPEWQDHFGRVSAALAGLRDRAERP